MHRNERTDDAALSRDAAGIGPHARPGIQLVSLRELDGYHVADGDADVRGWEVRTVSGREIGKVADMLVDTAANEVVMLDVDLAGTDRHTLAPVRAAQLDRTRRVVLLDTADLQDLDAVPSLRRNVAPTEAEGRQFHDGYQRAYGERGWGRDRDWQVQRGDHEVEFRRRDAELADATEQDAARRDRERQERERMEAEQRRQDAERAQSSSSQQGAGREVRWAQGQEEIVVERRPVIEEVVIRRRVVDPSALQGGVASSASGGGVGDRIANKADDLKDRVDGNPASRPGPDATDRR